ncbi:hypothetical protein [Acidovorax sp. FG27]|uniref:hypothetical protein n=1 Tax=Acidovorax sp. FG27 TaxID=3133652 RepID=UPI003340820A
MKRSPTKTVDNFVGNPLATARQTAPDHDFDRLMKNRAVKNALKSKACAGLLALPRVLGVSGFHPAALPALWTNPAARSAASPRPAYV